MSADLSEAGGNAMLPSDGTHTCQQGTSRDTLHLNFLRRLLITCSDPEAPAVDSKLGSSAQL